MLNNQYLENEMNHHMENTKIIVYAFVMMLGIVASTILGLSPEPATLWASPAFFALAFVVASLIGECE